MSTPWQLAAIRLVHWHNFTNVTIPVKGSLFLIGDNGAGKTTVLDAVHVALTGDHGVELNAAARVGGRRDDGRDLAGILLRNQMDTGFGRSAAVGYAVLELRRGEEALTLGVGAYAASPESRVERWGIFARRPLSEVALVDGDHVLDRSDLVRRLKPGEVLEIGRYRTAVAQLFSGRERFEEVAALLRAGKAYRELVARTANFSELFGELLAEPDAEAYAEVRRAMDAIEKIRADVEALGQERARLVDLTAWCEQVDQAREALARYDWLKARHDHAGARAREERARRAEEGAARELHEATRALEAEGSALSQARGELVRLEASEGGELLKHVAALRGDEARRTEEHGRRREQRAAREAETAREEAALDGAATALANAAGAASACLAAVHDKVAPELPVPALDAAGRLADRLASAGGAGRRAPDAELEARELRPLLDQVASGLRGRRGELQIAEHDARGEERRQAAAAQEKAHEAARLRNRGEVEPPLPGLEAAIGRLAERGIDARPVYRLVEPVGDDLLRPGFLERVLGAEVLGTLVVDDAVHEEALSIVLAECPGVPLAWTASGTQHVPGLRIAHPVAAALISGRLGTLATEPGGESFLLATGHLHHGGLDVRLAEGPPRFLGEAARRAALEAAVAALEAETARLQAGAREAGARALALGSRCEVLGEAEVLLARLDLDAVLGFQQEKRSAAARLESARTRLAESLREEEHAAGAVQEIARAITALERELDGRGLRALEMRIRELRDQIEAGGRRHEAASRRQAVADEARGRHARDLAAISVEVGEAARALDAARSSLLARVPVEARVDVETYVLRAKGGGQLKPENLPDHRARADRERYAAMERILGADGIRGPLLWQKYAFSYDEAENGIQDHQGHPLATILARVQGEVDELAQAVTAKQQELLERVVLEDLVGTLRGEVFGLEGIIRQINRQVSDLSFGGTRYRLEATLRPEFHTLHELLRTASGLSAAARAELKGFFQSRLAELGTAGDDGVPPLLDYRRWYEFHVRMAVTDDAGVQLSPRRLRKGSGGEQAVPNYLLLFCLASVLYERAGAAVRVLLIDEAFYGIDAGRREELLRFCGRLGITLVVATPEMDGVTEAMRASTTLFLEKLPSGKVCISDFVFENRPADLFGGGGLPDPADLVVGATG